MVKKSVSRRRFLGSGSLIAGGLAAPQLLTADKTGKKPVVIGEGEFQYECHHGWGQVPDSIKWVDTHGTAVDKSGLVYIKHRASKGVDTIAVFEPGSGKFVRSFGKEYAGGGHGIDVREENGTEYLYLCDTKGTVAKTTLKGEQVWTKKAPNATGFYDKNSPGKGRFSPTNIAFAPDGGFYVADGYGSHYLHRYNKDAHWEMSWGGQGTRMGKMRTPHSIWLDDRPGREVSLVVADRANARLQYFDLEGHHKGYVNEVSFPADFDTQGEVLLVPDLHARISLFDKDNKVITHLGYDPAWTKKVLDGFKMRGNPKSWEDGKFIHPHDACFDKAGNIYVAEWVASGRVSFLKKV